MNRLRRWLLAGVAVVLALVMIGIGLAYISVSSPEIPADAAATRIAIAGDLAAAAAPDPTGDDVFDAGPIESNACLDRIIRSGGWLDLCWQVSRLMNDSDPAQDYYFLRVWGTLHGNPAPSGLRWAVVRAVQASASAPINAGLDWPGSLVYEGGCQETSTDIGGPFPDESITVCGRTTGLGAGQGNATGLIWTCTGCLLPMSTDQSVLLAAGVTVREGGSPVWDLHADIGS